MPELPEVETVLRGIAPHLTGHTVANVIIRQPQLRWPVPRKLSALLGGRIIRGLRRRAKYLLLEFDHGTLILHLGMSGSLRVLPGSEPPQPHDHFDLVLEDGHVMRLRDPRRFGAVLWHEGDVMQHPLLAALGPEPLDRGFDGGYLHAAARGRRAAIKQFIMDSHVVVGVGNIYASEALFRAGIKPQLAAGRLSRERSMQLARSIKEVLRAAIRKGGSSLRDFVQSDGSPGYFQQHYFVYGRTGEPCRRCGTPIRQMRQGQRSTFWCPVCQR